VQPQIVPEQTTWKKVKVTTSPQKNQKNHPANGNCTEQIRTTKEQLMAATNYAAKRDIC